MASTVEPTVMSEKEAESMNSQRLRDELLDYKSLGCEIFTKATKNLMG